MRTIGSKKRFAFIAGTTAAILVGGGIAVGYWTTTGSGAGSADVGTSAALTINQTNTPDALYPGGPAEDIVGTIVNSTGGELQVTTLTATITTTAAGCDTDDFVFTSAIDGDSIDAGTNAGVTLGTLSMTNTSANQDACKNADLTLAFASV